MNIKYYTYLLKEKVRKYDTLILGVLLAINSSLHGWYEHPPVAVSIALAWVLILLYQLNLGKRWFTLEVEFSNNLLSLLEYYFTSDLVIADHFDFLCPNGVGLKYTATHNPVLVRTLKTFDTHGFYHAKPVFFGKAFYEKGCIYLPILVPIHYRRYCLSVPMYPSQKRLAIVGRPSMSLKESSKPPYAKTLVLNLYLGRVVGGKCNVTIVKALKDLNATIVELSSTIELL